MVAGASSVGTAALIISGVSPSRRGQHRHAFDLASRYRQVQGAVAVVVAQPELRWATQQVFDRASAPRARRMHEWSPEVAIDSIDIAVGVRRSFCRFADSVITGRCSSNHRPSGIVCATEIRCEIEQIFGGQGLQLINQSDDVEIWLARHLVPTKCFTLTKFSS
jgi:hypothetical protein